MTEAEWQLCRHPIGMLHFLHGHPVSDRKYRLFACACCRRLGGRLPDHLRAVLEAAEGLALGRTDPRQLAQLRRTIAWKNPMDRAVEGAADWPRANAEAAAYYAAWAAGPGVSRREELATQAALLREVVGPLPFRKVERQDPWLAWRDGWIPDLAREIFLEQHFEGVPVLGDALEEAGCTDAAILRHCHEAGPHVRGCWVVDLLLGQG
jgi:hypothetical protein